MHIPGDYHQFSDDLYIKNLNLSEQVNVAGKVQNTIYAPKGAQEEGIKNTVLDLFDKVKKMVPDISPPNVEVEHIDDKDPNANKFIVSIDSKFLEAYETASQKMLQNVEEGRKEAKRAKLEPLSTEETDKIIKVKQPTREEINSEGLDKYLTELPTSDIVERLKQVLVRTANTNEALGIWLVHASNNRLSYYITSILKNEDNNKLLISDRFVTYEEVVKNLINEESFNKWVRLTKDKRKISDLY